MYGGPSVNAVQAGHSMIRRRRQDGSKGQQQRHRCTMLRSEHMDAGRWTGASRSSANDAGRRLNFGLSIARASDPERVDGMLPRLWGSLSDALVA